MSDKKESIVYDYVKSQFETEKQFSQMIDARIGNYLVITGIFLGILVQVSPDFIGLSKILYSSTSFWPIVAWVIFIFASFCLLVSIMRILYIFTQMGYSIPGVGEKENYHKVIDSSETDSKNVTNEFIGNYVEAYKENLKKREIRTSNFKKIRAFMFLGIIATILFIFIYGFLKINEGDKKMGDKTTNSQSSTDKPAKPTVSQKPDHITLGNSKDKVVKVTVSQKTDQINVNEGNKK